MVVSGLACMISFFNLVMCAQNEFDPIVLETELILRREKYQEKKKREEEDAHALKR